MNRNSYDPHGDLPLADRKRRLVFRAWHRGIKELDLIMGNFVEANLDGFTDNDCAWFEKLFEEQDHEILGWITDGIEAPAPFEGEMMERLRKLDFMSLRAK